MAVRSQIVDFFGLPACGKSTLVEHVVSGHRISASVSISDKKNALKCSGLRFLLRYCRSIRIRDVYWCIRYHFSIPAEKRRKGSSLRLFIRNYIYYRYISSFSGYDIVLMDNGIVQSIVSHQGGNDLFGSPNHLRCVKKLLDKSNVTFVWCDSSPEVSLSRMENRGRAKGRIDLIKDKDLKLSELEKERGLYSRYAELLKSMGKSVVVLNNDLGVEEEAAQLEKYLGI